MDRIAYFHRPSQKGTMSEWSLGYIVRETEKAILVETVGETWIPKSVLTLTEVPEKCRDNHPTHESDSAEMKAAVGYELAEWYDRKNGNSIW